MSGFDADAAARELVQVHVAETLRRYVAAALHRAHAAGLLAAAALAERERDAHAAQAQQHAGHPRAVEYQARAEAAGALATMLRAAGEVQRG